MMDPDPIDSHIGMPCPGLMGLKSPCHITQARRIQDVESIVDVNRNECQMGMHTAHHVDQHQDNNAHGMATIITVNILT